MRNIKVLKNFLKASAAWSEFRRNMVRIEVKQSGKAIKDANPELKLEVGFSEKC